MTRQLAALIPCVLLAAACPSKPPPPDAAKVEAANDAAMKGAIADAKPTLQFGIALPHGTFMDAQTAVKVGAYMSKVLGQPVEPRLFSYDDLADAVVSGAVDIAYMPPLAYVEAARRAKVTLVRKSLHQGTPTYVSVVFVRKDSPVKSIKELKGKTIAWVQKGSASGNLVPRAWFRAHNIDLQTFFKDQLYLADHEKVCEAVYNLDVDSGASFADPHPASSTPEIVDGCRDALGDRVNNLRIIFSSTALPNDVIVVKAGAPAALASKLSDMLDHLGDSDEGKAVLKDGFHSDSFVAVSDDEFTSIRSLLNSSGEAVADEKKEEPAKADAAAPAKADAAAPANAAAPKANPAPKKDATAGK